MLQMSDIMPPNGTTPPQQPQATPGRSLSLAASDPMSFGGAFGSQSQTTDYAANFGKALQQMLQQAQQLGTHTQSQLQTGALNYSDAGLKASNTQLTNPALQGYNPSTIMNAASTAEQPYQTGAQGLQQVGSTFNEQLQNYGNILSNAQNVIDKNAALQRQQTQDAQGIVHDAISAGSDAVAALIKSQPDIIKLAGYNTGTLQGVITGLKKNENIKAFNAYGPPTPPPAPASIVDPVTDAKVQQIIASNPDNSKTGTGWGSAADAINALAPGTDLASKYDAQLKAVYQNKQSPTSIFGTNQNPAYANDKTQQKLEQEYRTVLGKEVSSRSGTLGIENAKVNQANHLSVLVKQYYDPKTGNYNIPKAQYNELAVGLANLISPTGGASEGTINSITQKTLKGDIAGAATYIFGTPVTGSTQDVINNLIDSIDRQGQQASDNIAQGTTFLHGLAPTDLDPKRIAKLDQNSLTNYKPIKSSKSSGTSQSGQTTNGLKYQVLP